MTDDETEAIQMAGFRVKVLRVLKRQQDRLLQNRDKAARKTLEVNRDGPVTTIPNLSALRVDRLCF